MSIVILSDRDDGEHIGAAELAERVLEVAPEATVRLVKGSMSGVQVDDAAAVRYLMGIYTASGNKRKGQ